MYSNNEINQAGQILIAPSLSEKEKNDALTFINAWRGYHVNPPINTIQVNLKKKALRIDPNAVLAQRLKKIASIKSKLERENNMKLSRMQDIGGCRAIMKDIECVYRLRDEMVNSRIKHVLSLEKDYIAQPKPSGYRGIHLAYRYMSDKKPDYCGMRVEVQIRTKLQHLWATAVETAGVFTNSALKASQGAEEWLIFFKYVSSLFALEENCAVVPNTPDVHEELILELKRINKIYNFSAQLNAFNSAIRETISAEDNYKYYLLKLHADQLFIQGYKKSELDQANIDYAQAELTEETQKTNVVLVAVESVAAMRQSYPNYFLDTREFNLLLARYLE